MASNPTAKQSLQESLLKALKEAGYSIERFTRKPESLTVCLGESDVFTKESHFLALEVCAAAELKAECRLFAAMPNPYLILTVNMPKAS